MSDTRKKQITFPSDALDELDRIAQQEGHNNTSIVIRRAVQFWLEYQGKSYDMTVTPGNPALLSNRHTG